ncbi:sulfatase-like hydrolase/transferase [Flavobacteriaceae bacterium S356]|uniref:Sulfatase-like hydrolase/transferase n=1 Tax=Asprobacillus argus TaxID=3076534 RepID=A0ABU3LEL6_9FLAO|nr:sulfatase-like hydrolase/transferase [Flavobacteriaceae bacterium S356]
MRSKKNFILLCVLVIICMLPNLLLVLVGEDSVVGTLTKKVVYLALGLAIIIFPLSFLKPKWYGWLVFLLSPFLLFELYNVYTFKAPSSEEAVASVFFTNYGEASELLDGGIITILSLIIAIVFIFFLTYFMSKDYKLSKKVRVRILAFSLLIFAGLYARNYMMASKLNDNFSETVGMANYSLRVQLRKIYPTDVLMKTNGAYTGLQKRKNYIENVKNFKFNAVKNDSLREQEIYVLVIGETARKHNFSLYGYQRNTTPNLDTIANIIPFNNVNSNANLTSLSIPFMLTRATPENASVKFEEPAVITPFKEVGFKTYWLTNVPSGIGSVFGFYSGLADEYKNTSVSLDALNYDEGLIPQLEKVLKDNTSRKKFIVLHTLGSHFRYNYRYPKEFEKFTPNLAKGLSIENSTDIANKDKIINSYDNSILYTDHILSEFIAQLKAQSAISYLYYISDHGENLYDDSANKLMHAYINPTKYEIEIPLFVWNSKQYKEQYHYKIENLLSHTSKRVQTINTFHTLLDLANIVYPNQNLKKSFSSTKFDTLSKTTFYRTDKTLLKIK